MFESRKCVLPVSLLTAQLDYYLKAVEKATISYRPDGTFELAYCEWQLDHMSDAVLE